MAWRRQVLGFACKAALGVAGSSLALWPLRASAQPSYTVSAQQMQQAVAERFPRRYPVGGLLELTLQAPQLRLLPDANRLGTLMPIAAAGPLLQRSYSGSFDVDFALRYEASDLSIRAHQLRVNALKLDGLPPAQAAWLDAYGPVLAGQTLQEVVLHRLTAQDLALPNAMGLQPGSLTVTAQGLVVEFVAKPAP